VCIAASTVGARVFTATSANGLAYMTEQVWWAAGARLPLVMCIANRAMAAPWNVLNDQQDSMSVRDAGWVQLYCRDNQEILDTTLQAYRIAERIDVPVMVCYDGFLLSHTVMPVDVPSPEQADAFLPPRPQPLQVVDPADPRNIGPVTLADPRADADGVLRPGYMELRALHHGAVLEALDVVGEVDAEYAAVTGRSWGGLVWDYRLEDADVAVVAAGSLTTQLTLAGRYLVYLPRTAVLGVSRRLDDAERDRLRSICKTLDPAPGGMIIRTAAEGADEEALGRDLRFLQRVWEGVERRIRVAGAPSLVYTEADLAMRAVRDLLGPEFDAVLVDDMKLHRRLAGYLRAVSPDLAGRVELREGDIPLFERLGLDEEVGKALRRRVELPSGGYIVIDHTEAMTVIDVNTGRYVGRRFLEDTILRTNVDACREIVRQLRLRDIGGIIVVDFIDMASRSNRDAVLMALEAELAQDRTKTYVVEVSPLGLVEMTRQNVARGLSEVLTMPCPCCHGDGRVVSEESALITVERRLRALVLTSTSPGLRVEVHPRIAARLLGGRNPLLRQVEQETGHRIFLQAADEKAALDHLAVVAD